MSEQQLLRFITLFALYTAQGLPIGFIDFVLPAWMAQNGATAAQVGAVLGFVALPWSFKLFHGFLMDRFTFLAMGRRRPWIIGSQVGIVLGLVLLALVNPPASAVAVIAALAFVVNLCTSVQDVAVDGLAVEILPESERARANGFMFGGQAIGIALGAAAGGYLVAYEGLPAALLAIAAMIAAVLLLVISIRERPGERALPWTAGIASAESKSRQLGGFRAIARQLGTALNRREVLLILPALFFTGAAYGLFLALAPLFSVAELGWGKAIYSSWSSQANLAAGLAGGLIFGAIAQRFGPRRLFIIAMLGFSALALFMLLMREAWAEPRFFIAAMFGYAALATLRAVAMGAVAMRLSVPAVAASQFALFMAVVNLGRAVASATLGWLDATGGFIAMFLAIVVVGIASASFALASKAGP